MNYITWLYFTKNKDNNFIFIYGLSLPTKSDYQVTKSQRFKVTNNLDIMCYTTISDKNIFNENRLDFENFIQENIYSCDIIHKKQTIQSNNSSDKVTIPQSIFQKPINVKTYYTSSLEDQDFKEEELALIAKELENLTNQPFSNNYSKRLFSFEIFEISLDLEETNKSDLELNRDRNLEQDKGIYFFKKSESDINEYLIHLIVYNEDKEVIFDGFKLIKKEDIRTEIFTSNLSIDGSMEYWIFDLSGKLLDKNKYSFFKYMSHSIQLRSETYEISKSNFSKRSRLSRQNQMVETYSSTIGSRMGEPNRVESFINIISNNIKNYFDTKEQRSFFFEKGDNFYDLKNFLNKLIEKDSCTLTIIDPYVSENSLDYLYLLENKSVKIRLISCRNESFDKLKENLNLLKDFNIPLSNLSFYNLKEKSFHDRYIHIKSNEKEEVYSLSNSINNLLINYPNILLVKIEDTTKKKLLEYFNNKIFKKCDDSTIVYP